MCPQMDFSLHANIPQAGFLWAGHVPGLYVQAQHFPAEGTLTAMTKPLLHSLLLSELYIDISLYVINFLSYSVSQLQDFYPMIHLALLPKRLCFFPLCFALFCFCVTKTAKHVSLPLGIPVLWATVPYANLSQKEFSRPSTLNYTCFYFMAALDQLRSFWCSWPMAMVHILPKVLSSAVGHTASLGLTLPCHRQFLQRCLKISLA